MSTTLDPSHVLSVNQYAALTWTFTTAAIITTSLRLGVRTFVVESLGADDGLILFGQLGAIAVTALSHWHIAVSWDLYIAYRDTGPIALLTTEKLQAMDILYRSGFLVEAIYLLTLPLVKCSILALYQRIVPLGRHRHYLYLFALIIVVQSFIILMLGTFSVDPPSAWWNFATAESRILYKHDHLQTINSAFQVLFDLIILALPIRVILRTKFKRRDRVGLIVIYLISLTSLVATITRLVKVAQFEVTEDSVDTMVRHLDYTYWAIIEIMTAIMCANLPAMPSLIRHISRNKSRVVSMIPRTRSQITDLHTSNHKSSRFRKWLDKSSSAISNSFNSAKRERSEHQSVSMTELTEKKSNSAGNEQLDFEIASHSKETEYNLRVLTANEDKDVNSIVAISPPVTATPPSSRPCDSDDTNRGKIGVICRTDELDVHTSIP